MSSLRLLEVVVPAGRADDLKALLSEEQELVGCWTETLDAQTTRARLLLRRDHTEGVTDRLSDRFGAVEGFRLVLFDVEATVPHVEEPHVEEEPAGGVEAVAAPPEEPARVSREELYTELEEASELSPIYLVTVALSTLVVGIGLVRGDIAVVIGAMVIAPLLGPNVALALAATLGDGTLAVRSLKTIGAGVAVASVLSVSMGMVLDVDPAVPEIARRTSASLPDLALALAAGSAGSLAFTSGISTALIGVMVAVALLPPLATAGLLIGSGYGAEAGGALLLVLANVACINLAGVVTFLARRVRPRSWWEEERARRAIRVAVWFWSVVLALVVLVILLIWER